MKTLLGILVALLLMSSCAMSQSLLTTMKRDGMWYLSLSGTDKMVYIMGFIDGKGMSTEDITVDQIKTELDSFLAETEDPSKMMIADALPTVIEKLKTTTK